MFKMPDGESQMKGELIDLVLTSSSAAVQDEKRSLAGASVGACDRSGSAAHAQSACAAACDPRIARSKAALREAMIELMEERGFDAFTVNDLCQRAGLNRGTFYNHFKDKDSLLLAFENEVLAELDEFSRKMGELSIMELMRYRVSKKPLPVLVELFDYVRKEGAFFHAVLGPGGDVRFGPQLREAVCSKLIMSLLHDRYREDPTPFVNYYIAYFAGAYVSVIVRWIETGMRETPEEMAVIAVRLFFIKPGESITL